jgi:hypothetical protein
VTRLVVQGTVFAALLGVWTWKLVSPNPVPDDLRSGLDDLGLAYLAAKSLHLSGYAFLTVLAATLPVPRWWRVGLVLMLYAHGVATEVIQTFVPNRTGKATDVLIDWAGITLGAFAVRLRNRRGGTRP